MSDNEKRFSCIKSLKAMNSNEQKPVNEGKTFLSVSKLFILITFIAAFEHCAANFSRKDNFT